MNTPTNIEVTAPDTDGFTEDDKKFEIKGPNGGKTFTVEFKKDYLLSGNAAKEIKVTYKAKLNDKATSGFDANTNTARGLMNGLRIMRQTKEQAGIPMIYHLVLRTCGLK